MEENNENVPEVTNETTEPTSEKSTRWIGLAAIIAFFVLGGWSYCPWYMWIVVVLLALLTFGGIWKWTQLILGACIILWGTPLLGSDSHRGSSSSSSSYEYHQTETKQSESERRYIESSLSELESLKKRFDRADQLGLSQLEQKRISDQADYIYRQLKQKNLTPEQSNRLSRMFAL